MNEAIKKAEIVVLAIKPKDLPAFVADSAPAFKHAPMIVSVLAGKSVALLKQNFPSCVIVRIMPNLPMICGEGVIGFVQTPQMKPDLKKALEEAFDGLGLLLWLSENQLEGLSAIAGSVPAFNLVMIQAMIDSAIMLGFTRSRRKSMS